MNIFILIPTITEYFIYAIMILLIAKWVLSKSSIEPELKWKWGRRMGIIILILAVIVLLDVALGFSGDFFGH